MKNDALWLFEILIIFLDDLLNPAISLQMSLTSGGQNNPEFIDNLYQTINL